MSDDRPSNPQPDPGVYQLAYDAAVRNLAEQQAAVSEARTRTAALLTATGVITAFFAGAARLNQGDVGFVGALATVVFLGVAGVCIWLLLPWRHWEFWMSPTVIVRGYAEAHPPKTLPQTHRDLALYMNQSYGRNKTRLDNMYVRFEVAVGLLLVEVVLWMFELS